VHLQEGLLEGVLGQGPIAQKPQQKAQQIVAVPLDQGAEGLGLALAVGLEQGLVAARLRGAVGGLAGVLGGDDWASRRRVRSAGGGADGGRRRLPLVALEA